MRSRQDKLLVYQHLRHVMVVGGLGSCQFVFIINSDWTIMMIIKTTTFITADTPGPVYVHWSGLTVVTPHLFSLYSLFAQLFTLMFCKKEKKNVFFALFHVQ